MSKTLLNIEAIFEAIAKIESYTKDAKSADELYFDQKSFDATMMQFVVMGEAIARIDDQFKNRHQNIPWQKIKDFRNIVAHDYFGIDADEIWDIVTNKIPELKAELEKIPKP